MSSRELFQIEVDGFKIFKDKSIVGPFPHLTCIMGPNGSGKSCLVSVSVNVLIGMFCVTQFEAVAFALGGNTKLIRKENVMSLINEQRLNDRNPSASVTLFCVLCDIL